MPKDPVDITVLTERPAIRGDAVSELDIVIDIKCRFADGADRVAGAMNLCLVVDRSGSMQGGGKLETAKRSCVDIFRRVADDDLFTVVAFDNEASVVVNPRTPKSEVERLILQLQPGAATNLALGWSQGLLELQTYATESHYSRLILLSDGMANAGETKKSVLANVATRSRDAGITTSTIGIGRDFSEDLLEAIATASGGRFWYIGESRIENILEEEFRGALSVAVDRPRVELTLPAGVTVSRELNSLRKISRRYGVRPLKGQDLFCFAVRLEVDPARVGADRFAIGAVLYDGDQQLVATEQAVAFAAQEEVARTEYHPMVRSVIENYEASNTDEKLLGSMDEGDMASMRKMLADEILKLRDVRRGMDTYAAPHDTQRFAAEVRDLAMHLMMDEASEAITDLVSAYQGEPDVQDLIGSWRKGLKQGQQRRAMGAKDTSRPDVDVWIDLLVRAISLADFLMQRFPDDRERLEHMRERLREQLAAIR